MTEHQEIVTRKFASNLKLNIKPIKMFKKKELAKNSKQASCFIIYHQINVISFMVLRVLSFNCFIMKVVDRVDCMKGKLLFYLLKI